MADITVSNIDELRQALNPANAGKTIHVVGGNYLVTEPLKVPDGVTLDGGGEVPGLPDRPIFWGHAALRAASGFTGDMLTLGAGARLVGLFIADAEQRPGNLIVLSSTGTGSSAMATIERCELRNPERTLAGTDGPLGRAILVVTRTGDLRSNLGLTVQDCAIRSSLSGTGLFAVNFAADSRLFVRLLHNRIGGGLDAAGGVSRPAAVSGSEVIIDSKDNLYCWEGGAPGGSGWSLNGGSNPPRATIPGGPTSGNRVALGSMNDRIEGFLVGVRATGGSRPVNTTTDGAHGPVSGNRAELALDGTIIRSGELDFFLAGGRAGRGDESEPPDFAPGDDNRLSLLLRKLKWTDKRNLYGHVLAASGEKMAQENLGNGNRVSIGPSLASFVQENDVSDTLPAGSFFA